MIKHIVLFKLRDDVDKSVKATRLPSIRDQFLALMGEIPTLRSIEIGLNCNAKEKFDLALVATFDDLDGLSAYATDPRLTCEPALTTRFNPDERGDDNKNESP